MIVYKENPKELTKSLLELISNYSQVVRHKVNTQKSITFLYASNEQMEFEIKNSLSFILVPLKNEILRYKSNQIYLSSI